MKVRFELIFGSLDNYWFFLFADPCDLKCSREFKPFCGSNSKTYNNDCLKKEDECRTASQIDVVKAGPCEDSPIVEVEGRGKKKFSISSSFNIFTLILKQTNVTESAEEIFNLCAATKEKPIQIYVNLTKPTAKKEILCSLPGILHVTLTILIYEQIKVTYNL